MVATHLLHYHESSQEVFSSNFIFWFMARYKQRGKNVQIYIKMNSATQRCKQARLRQNHWCLRANAPLQKPKKVHSLKKITLIQLCFSSCLSPEYVTGPQFALYQLKGRGFVVKTPTSCDRLTLASIWINSTKSNVDANHMLTTALIKSSYPFYSSSPSVKKHCFTQHLMPHRRKIVD